MRDKKPLKPVNQIKPILHTVGPSNPWPDLRVYVSISQT